MNTLDILFLAVALAMDCFTVSIVSGVIMKRWTAGPMLRMSLLFGLFQALMPLAGWLGISFFSTYLASVDHWIAFVLLLLIGGNMIREALSKEEETANDSFSFKTMIVLAIATSIDALAVGITFGLLPDVNIVAAVSFIGVITFILSALGLKIGNIFGLKYKSKAELAGGVILILIGTKILLEHLGVINF